MAWNRCVHNHRTPDLCIWKCFWIIFCSKFHSVNIFFKFSINWKLEKESKKAYRSASEPPWRFTVPELKKVSPYTSAVSVGRRCKKPSSQNEFERLLVYHWNSHFWNGNQLKNLQLFKHSTVRTASRKWKMLVNHLQSFDIKSTKRYKVYSKMFSQFVRKKM